MSLLPMTKNLGNCSTILTLFPFKCSFKERKNNTKEKQKNPCVSKLHLKNCSMLGDIFHSLFLRLNKSTLAAFHHPKLKKGMGTICFWTYLSAAKLSNCKNKNSVNFSPTSKPMNISRYIEYECPSGPSWVWTAEQVNQKPKQGRLRSQESGVKLEDRNQGKHCSGRSLTRFCYSVNHHEHLWHLKKQNQLYVES